MRLVRCFKWTQAAQSVPVKKWLILFSPSLFWPQILTFSPTLQFKHSSPLDSFPVASRLLPSRRQPNQQKLHLQPALQQLHCLIRAERIRTRSSKWCRSTLCERRVFMLLCLVSKVHLTGPEILNGDKDQTQIVCNRPPLKGKGGRYCFSLYLRLCLFTNDLTTTGWALKMDTTQALLH